MKTFIQENFKSTSNSVRSGLSEYGISLKLKKSRELLAQTLTGKSWRSLSPALPVTLKQDIKAEAERMSTWLTNHNKPIIPSECENILSIAYAENNTDWFNSVDLQKLSKEVAPLSSRIDMTDNPSNAAIVINPENQTVYCKTEPSPGSLSVVYGRKYEFEIPSNITGKALVQILTHPDFNSLLKSINNSWQLEWDGRNQIGKLNDKAKDDLENFQEWLIVTDPDRCDVMHVNDFLEPVTGIDSNGEELEIDELDEAISIFILNSHTITPSTDIEALLDSLEKLIDSETVVIDLEQFIKSCHETVCNNATVPA